MKQIKKSIFAALLIGLGNFALLKIGAPLGQFLFSLGLMGVCVLGANLFTGKCGFLLEEKQKVLHLALILVLNLIFGYLIGVLFSLTDSTLTATALEKVATWELSLPYFLKSFFCGVVMYVAVKMYKRGSIWGILLGVPLFLFCGWQHSIANVITMGVARTVSPALGICVAGNFIGSLTTSILQGD